MNTTVIQLKLKKAKDAINLFNHRIERASDNDMSRTVNQERVAQLQKLVAELEKEMDKDKSNEKA